MMHRSELIPLENEFVRASDPDILEIQKISGAQLPASYVSFLKEVGLSTFDGDAQVKTEEGDVQEVLTFFGGGEGPMSVIDDLRLHDDLLGQQLIPIADDSVNNRYFLDVLQNGRIRYLDYYARPNVVVEVAPSFDDFLARIQVVPEPE